MLKRLALGTCQLPDLLGGLGQRSQQGIGKSPFSGLDPKGPVGKDGGDGDCLVCPEMEIELAWLIKDAFRSKPFVIVIAAVGADGKCLLFSSLPSTPPSPRLSVFWFRCHQGYSHHVIKDTAKAGQSVLYREGGFSVKGLGG